MSPPKPYLALVHYPVVNKKNEVIASAITNLDIHDIARAAATYGVGGYYLVTPLVDQQQLAHDIIRHWTEGWGATYNTKRRQAFGTIQVADTLQAVIDRIATSEGVRPRVVVTSARSTPQSVAYDDFKSRLRDDPATPNLLVFGTAWGLGAEIIAGADLVLDPIVGVGDYNHLSVRSAVAIVLDRLFGRITRAET